jgi:hypothetical protein
MKPLISGQTRVETEMESRGLKQPLTKSDRIVWRVQDPLLPAVYLTRGGPMTLTKPGGPATRAGRSRPSAVSGVPARQAWQVARGRGGTSRRVPSGSVGRRLMGKHDADHGAARWLGAERQGAVMRIDDAMDNSQAQPGAGPFRGIEQ